MILIKPLEYTAYWLHPYTDFYHSDSELTMIRLCFEITFELKCPSWWGVLQAEYVQIVKREALLAMHFWVNTLETIVLAADHRPTHYQDRDLDNARTDQTLKTTCTNSKHWKRWVWHRTWWAHAENARVRSCLNICTAVYSKFRQGRNTITDNWWERENFDADTSS